jgi:type IV secretion system protein VirD4
MPDPSQEYIDLLDDLPRGRDAQHVGSAPHNYFESPKNLAATESLRFEPQQNIQAKLFLGVVGAQFKSLRLQDGRISRYAVGGTPIGLADDRHHTLIAGSRAGKGRAVLINQLLSLPAHTSIVCLDPKGELCRTTFAHRKSIGTALVADPFNLTGSATEANRIAINPIDILCRSDPRMMGANAKLIADSLIVPEGTKERHWDDTARQGLAGLCLHIATHPRYENIRDLVTVWRCAAELAVPDPNEPGRYLLEREMLANDAAGGMVRVTCRNFYDRTGAEFSSVLSNMRRHLDFIGNECMRDCLTGPSIDLRDLKRKAMTLYVCVPAMRMTDLAGWLRLVVMLTLAAHEEESEQSGGSTVLMLEEAQILGALPALEAAAAQFSGVIKMITVLQDLSQLQRNYPQSWETFIGNSGCLQVFGLADYTTQEYISKRLGEAPTITRSTNMPGYDQASQHAITGESWSLGVSRLLTAEEVGRYFSRDDAKLRQLILRPGFRPAILTRAFYDQHELFRGRLHVS